MEAIRTIIDAERLATIIDLPESMRHGEVEVIVLEKSEIQLSLEAENQRLKEEVERLKNDI